MVSGWTMAPRFSFALIFATIAWLAARLHGSAVELATDGSGFADDDRWLNDGTYNFDTSYCNIPRFGNVSRREFATRIMGKTPAIMSLNRTRNAVFARLTERDNLLREMGNKSVRISAQNSYSHLRIETTVKEYFEKWVPEQENAADSNTTYYFFGENFAKHWDDLNKAYRVPDLPSTEHTSLSFGIGGRGSGVAFHFHGPAMVEQFYGRKRWFFYRFKEKPNFNPDLTQGQWLNSEYKQLPQSRMPMECTVHPGELMYFPTHWYHSTLNIDPYTVFMATFTREDEITI